MNPKTRKDDPFSGSGGAVQLDFPALPIRWHNGNIHTSPDKGVEYFGGWCSTKAETFEAVIAELGIEPPVEWMKQTMTNDDGEKFDAYACRALTFAPIRKRKAWFLNRKSGKQNSVTEILGYMAIPNIKTRVYVPWGFVVARATSLTGKAIEDLLAEWAGKIRPLLKLPDMPSSATGDYWMTIGTFGEKIVTQKYTGKGGESSTVTPCQIMPAETTADYLKRRWIGAEISAVCGEAFDNAAEWAADWNERDSRKTTSGGDESDVQPPDSPPDEVPF